MTFGLTPPDEIVERCSAVLAERPDDAEAARDLGAVLNDSVQLERAMHALAGSAAPARVAALGLMHQVMGAREDARAAYRRAVAGDPAQVVALRGLMTLAQSPTESEEATDLLQSALKHDPEQAVLMADLGGALYRARRYAQALPLLERALQLRPQSTVTARQCFFLLQELGEPERARAVFARHLIGKRDPVLELHAATLLPPIPSSAAHIARWRDRFRRQVAALCQDPPALTDAAQGFARSLFLLAYHGLDDRDLRADLAQLYRRASPDLSFTAPHCIAPAARPAGRIKLGLVSSFFRDHTIGKLNLGFAERLPRDRFEVTVFAVPGRADAMTQRYRAAADRFVVLPPKLADARALIAQSRQDALFYPEIGMEALSYTLAFARLAPLQFTTWGHPETSGIDTIDVFLSSAWLESAEAERQYTERLVRLDALPAAPVLPEAKRRFERAHLGLPEDKRLYACPQTLFKFHPSFDPMLAAILARDPDGLLVLLEGATPEWVAKLTRRLRRAGIDTERQVRFLPQMPLDQYLSLCRVADVVLDPPVFGGGNSTYEALYQDAVVVTLEGEFLRGRISAAMYRKMGLADLIPADARGYVDLALRVAQDKAFRAEQRARIAERRHLIYDNDDGVKAMAAFVEDAVAP